jgi:hypothetical protein
MCGTAGAFCLEEYVMCQVLPTLHTNCPDPEDLLSQLHGSAKPTDSQTTESRPGRSACSERRPIRVLVSRCAGKGEKRCIPDFNRCDRTNQSLIRSHARNNWTTNTQRHVRFGRCYPQRSTDSSRLEPDAPVLILPIGRPHVFVVVLRAQVGKASSAVHATRAIGDPAAHSAPPVTTPTTRAIACRKCC